MHNLVTVNFCNSEFLENFSFYNLNTIFMTKTVRVTVYPLTKAKKIKYKVHFQTEGNDTTSQCRANLTQSGFVMLRPDVHHNTVL